MFSPGAVRKGAGMRTSESAFQWLASAMTVNLAYNATEPNLGLELSSDGHGRIRDEVARQVHAQV